MKYRLTCGDAMPGCTARFEDESKDEIMRQVAVHAKRDHGVADVTPEMLDAIAGNIVPV
jgi:predicted small metal-binding protein